jgi:naphthoate synthase
MNPDWKVAKTYTDILYHKAGGIARVTINRPAKRNAFRPLTVSEMYDAFADAREDPAIGVVLLTGAGPHTDGKYAFLRRRRPERPRPCGLHRRGRRAPAQRPRSSETHPLDAQGGDRAGGRLRHRRRPCAARGLRSEPRGRQRDLRPGGTADGEFRWGIRIELPRPRRRPEEGAGDLVPLPPVQRSRGLQMGLVNAVVPVAQLEQEGVRWAREILQKSPLAIRLLKSAFNAELDGQAGIQELAGNATLLYYMSDEAKEFMTAQREKRAPQARKYPWLP